MWERLVNNEMFQNVVAYGICFIVGLALTLLINYLLFGIGKV